MKEWDFSPALHLEHYIQTCTDRILYNHDLYFKEKQLRILFSFKHIKILGAWSCEWFASSTQKRF